MVLGESTQSRRFLERGGSHLLYSRFLYDFVTFPNGVFSGTIISSVIHDGSIKRTAEWQLLLGAIALPGVFVGAYLCNPFGRRNTVYDLIYPVLLFYVHSLYAFSQMMLGFSGYLIFGKCARDKVLGACYLIIIHSFHRFNHWIGIRQDHQHHPSLRHLVSFGTSLIRRTLLKDWSATVSCNRSVTWVPVIFWVS